MCMLKVHEFYAFQGPTFEDFVSTGQACYKYVYNKAGFDGCL